METVNDALGYYNLISIKIQLHDSSVQIILDTSAGSAKPTEKIFQLHWLVLT